MKTNSYVSSLLAGGALAMSAMAEIFPFPGCDWSETSIKANDKRVMVVDSKNRPILSIQAEPHTISLAKLVVSQAVDRLVIDPRALFDNGLSKLVMSSTNYDTGSLAGNEATVVCEMGGKSGTDGLMYFEGHTKSKTHFYISRNFTTKNHRRKYSLTAMIPEDIANLHVRWDITSARKGALELYGARLGPAKEFPVSAKPKKVEPELIFHAPFDGTANAAFAKGSATPIKASGLSWDEGMRGQAVRLTAKSKSVLDYAVTNNLVQERGTVSLWFKREWGDNGIDKKNREIWRMLFSNPNPKTCPRVGSGQLMFWFWGKYLRCDQSDDDDAFAIVRSMPKDGWNHLAATWDELGVRIYLNGRSFRSTVGDSNSPMAAALKETSYDMLNFSREIFSTFGVGHCSGAKQFDGLIDELRIYSAPLTYEQIKEIWKRETVIDISLQNPYAIAGTPNDLIVSATSPAGRDISNFSYCICDESDKVLRRFNEPVTGKPTKLNVELPPGSYSVKATDGKELYGKVPYTVLRKNNPYEITGDAAAAALKAPGVPSRLTLLETLTLDKLPPADRFRAVGPTQIKQLNGTSYLEAGSKVGNRYAIRFDIDAKASLLLFEIDYPDNDVRTADLIIQHAKNPSSDYTMQVGYAAGDEYPNSGRILTHRCLYWTQEPQIALVAMTARENAPAAISAVRIYRVEGGALPAPEMHEPKENPQGWRRSFGLYFEDPAIGYDFATKGHTTECLDDLIDRTAALMKFTGQNLFAYPGAWYHGLIGEKYNPRQHAPDFLSAWYAKFDNESLEIMPTVNPNTMPVPDGLVTRTTMSNGALHPSPIAIHDTGKPNWGKWHDSPPNFNFHHPDVQNYISGIIDALVKQGVSHPSFKGVCMHMTRHCMLWFGDEQSGYNDYTVEAFAKAKGITIPVSKDDPLRGKAYAEWLREHAWADWIQWRCDIVTAFYANIARKLASARPDLKLWLNSFVPANVRHPDFTNPDYMEQANRACGLDRDALTAAIPNLILCQTLVPADYRWRRSNNYPSEAAFAHQRVLDTLPGFYSLLRGAAYPWVNQHDRYWESPIGRGGKKGSSSTLSCDWLNECTWRVSTINPAGFHALRHFVLPLRYGDVLGMSKGGFLIGTYGMEEHLVPFAQAFRSLPAVVFNDAGGTETVKLRHKEFDGKSWFYIVNTDMKPATVKLSVPGRTRDLVTGEQVGGQLSGETLTLTLPPYSMRSYAAPNGRPQFISM